MIRLIILHALCLWSCWGLVGALVSLALPCHRRWDDGALWCVVRGPVADWFHRRGWTGVAIGWTVLLWYEPLSPYARPHERRHVTQAYVLGPLYLPLYLALLPLGRRYHPMELDARRASGRPDWRTP